MQGVSPFLFPFGDRIQLCVLPVPRRAESTGRFGLAPARWFVSSTTGQPRSFNVIVHTPHRPFLQLYPAISVCFLLVAACTVERGLSSESNSVSGPPTPSKRWWKALTFQYDASRIAVSVRVLARRSCLLASSIWPRGNLCRGSVALRRRP